ncbi:uncharacterized protein LOC113272478 [Papaver somniferum]|uniref:uncharacterized protein LOC113272478 n=1 Tax=Papaver somniferum TaxID=3469 RepID=UPI000E6FFB75|nr:uncharacterized protein LOC113272478 [Papaver somniferum]
MPEHSALQRVNQFGFQNHCIVASVGKVEDCGNFHAIVSGDENFGGLPALNSNIPYFNNFIKPNHLIDLGYKGPAYTWTNGRDIEGLIRQRLDRVLENPEWCTGFHNATVLHLHRMDEEEDIQSTLRKLGSFLTELNRRRIGCVKHKITILKPKLLMIQAWRPSSSNIQKEKLVVAELKKYPIMEATYWDQRMKRQWAKSGDQNTRYLHLYVRKRRRTKTIIHLLKDDQTWMSDQGEISRQLTHHFQTLFQETTSPDPPQFIIQGHAVFNLDNDVLCNQDGFFHFTRTGWLFSHVLQEVLGYGL